MTRPNGQYDWDTCTPMYMRYTMLTCGTAPHPGLIDNHIGRVSPQVCWSYSGVVAGHPSKGVVSVNGSLSNLTNQDFSEQPQLVKSQHLVETSTSKNLQKNVFICGFHREQCNKP